MLLLLDDYHKAHLGLLSSINLEATEKLLAIVLDMLENGADKNKIEQASKVMNAPTETAEHCLEGIMYLYIESCKLMLSEIDFHDTLMTVGMSEPLRKTLLDIYLEHRGAIRQILQGSSMQPLQYHDLEWRLNVKVASRSLRGQTIPNILMKLYTRQGDDYQSELLECDIPNLVNMTGNLEEALNEAKSQYTRRILRNVQ